MNLLMHVAQGLDAPAFQGLVTFLEQRAQAAWLAVHGNRRKGLLGRLFRALDPQGQGWVDAQVCGPAGSLCAPEGPVEGAATERETHVRCVRLACVFNVCGPYFLSPCAFFCTYGSLHLWAAQGHKASCL